MSATTPTFLAAALAYAAHGWAVFPLYEPTGDGCSCGKTTCKDVGKHPRTANGFHDATTDEGQIRRWWRTWPNANIGTPTGPERLVVDAEAGLGQDTLDGWQAAHGLLPATAPLVQTGGGGIHVYLTIPPDLPIRSSVKKVGAGIDIRAVGGYVVLPPSLHESGQRYHWLDPIKPPPRAPEWLIQLILAAARNPNSGPVGDDGGPIPEGARNSTLTCIAGRMRRADLTDDEIAGALQRINRERCQPPLPEDEVATIARSISRYPAGSATGAAAATSPNGTSPGVPYLVIHRLSDIEPKAIEWLWPRWFARGKFHLFGGLAGDGKGTITAALAAIGSRGGVWPDGSDAPHFRSLFVLAEDALDDTLRPRLDLHNADVHNVFGLGGVFEEDGGERFFHIEQHLPLLQEAALDLRVDVVWIDPLMTIMPGRDRNSEGDTRDALTPLIRWGESTGIATMGVAHVGKPTATTRTPAQRILGATAFHALARVVWMTTADDDKMALGVAKSNLAIKPLPLQWSRELDQPITWHGTAARNLDAIFEKSGMELPRDRAEAFLREMLGEGPRLGSAVEVAAQNVGISEMTLRRTCNLLDVQKVKQKGVVNGRSVWSLPAIGTPGVLPTTQATMDLDRHT